VCSRISRCRCCFTRSSSRSSCSSSVMKVSPASESLEWTVGLGARSSIRPLHFHDLPIGKVRLCAPGADQVCLHLLGRRRRSEHLGAQLGEPLDLLPGRDVARLDVPELPNPLLPLGSDWTADGSMIVCAHHGPVERAIPFEWLTRGLPGGRENDLSI